MPVTRKTRTREHIIASQSVAHVEKFIVAAGHTVERPSSDYGYEFQKLNVSHEALGEALGYRFTQYETHRSYEKPSYGSILMLPAHTPTEQRVRPAHLLAVRHAVVPFGVADVETLASLLVRFTRSEPTPAPRTGFRAARALRPAKPRRAAAKSALEV